MTGFPIGGSDRFSGNHQPHDIGQFLRIIWQKISGHFRNQEKQEIALHADHGWRQRMRFKSDDHRPALGIGKSCTNISFGLFLWFVLIPFFSIFQAISGMKRFDSPAQKYWQNIYETKSLWKRYVISKKTTCCLCPFLGRQEILSTLLVKKAISQKKTASWQK